MNGEDWTLHARDLAHEAALESKAMPESFGRFRSLAATWGDATVMVVTVVVPNSGVTPEQVAGPTAEAVRRAFAEGEGTKK